MQQIDTHHIMSRLEGVSKGNRGAIIQEFAEMYGCSTDTVYRALRKQFGPAKKVKRTKKIDPTNKLIDEIAKIKQKGKAEGAHEREMATDICIKKLIDRGLEGAEDLTVATVNRRLQELGYRQRKTIVRVEADYPNQQHQMDFSRSEYFQLLRFDPELNDFIVKVQKQLKYKQEDKTKRTWLVCIVDAYSRVGFARMYAATGESLALGIKHMNYVYKAYEDEEPLLYLPDTLKLDNGAFAKNKAVKNMARAMDINLEFVLPYKKRGIQKAESFWKLLWKRFELPLMEEVGHGKTMLLSEYNSELQHFCIENLEALHPIKSVPKGHVYNSSLMKKEQRKIDVNLQDVAFRVWERKVNDACLISIDRIEYQAPEKAVGKWISVFINYAGEYVAELRDEYSKVFTLKRLSSGSSTKLGNFEHRQHQTYQQKIDQNIKADASTQFGNQKNHLDINFMPHRDKAIVPDTKFNSVGKDKEFESLFEAKVYIGQRLPGEWDYSDVASYLDPLLEAEGGLNVEFINKLVDGILNNLNNTAVG